MEITGLLMGELWRSELNDVAAVDFLSDGLSLLQRLKGRLEVEGSGDAVRPELIEAEARDARAIYERIVEEPARAAGWKPRRA